MVTLVGIWTLYSVLVLGCVGVWCLGIWLDRKFSVGFIAVIGASIAISLSFGVGLLIGYLIITLRGV